MIDYHQLAANSKVWVYQSNRRLNDLEVEQIEKYLWEFVGQWASHSNKVKGFGKVYHQHFIVLIADESDYNVSGCSTDSSVHFIKEMEKLTGANFFDRSIVACEVDGEVKLFSSIEFRQLLASDDLDENSIVFNNLVQTKAEFESSWKTTVGQSWHQKVYGVSM